MLDYTKAELKALHNADDKPSGALPRAIRLACPTSRVLEIGFSGAQRLITYREEGLVAFGVTASSLARGRWMVCRPLDQLPAFAHTVRPDIMILWRTLHENAKRANAALLSLLRQIQCPLVVEPGRDLTFADAAWLLCARGYVKHAAHPLDQLFREKGWGCRVWVPEGVCHPIVSVLIPAYNRATTLPATMASVMAQTHPYVELIVVDDGSTDDTYGVALKCAEQRPPTMTFTARRITHGGPSRARNTGFAIATGDYILPFDSDDTMPPDFVARMVEQATPDRVVFPGKQINVPLESVDNTGLVSYLDRHPMPPRAHGPFLEQVGPFAVKCYHADSVDWIEHVGPAPVCCLVPYSRWQRFRDHPEAHEDWIWHHDLRREGLDYSRADTAFFVYGMHEDQVGRDHSVVATLAAMGPLAPRIGFVSLGADGHKKSLASTRVRAEYISCYIHSSRVLESMDELRDTWGDYEALVFCNPFAPQLLGWAEYLKGEERIVIADYCVAEWLRDPSLLGLARRFCDVADAVLTPSPLIAADLDVDAIIVPDRFDLRAYATPKHDYELTGRLCWHGDTGNIPALLALSEPLSEVCQNRDLFVEINTRWGGRINSLAIPFPHERREWAEETWIHRLAQADLVLEPRLSSPLYARKSRNKVSSAELLGVPYVAGTPSASWVGMIDSVLDLSAEERKVEATGKRHAAILTYDVKLSAAHLLALVRGRLAL